MKKGIKQVTVLGIMLGGFATIPVQAAMPLQKMIGSTNSTTTNIIGGGQYPNSDVEYDNDGNAVEITDEQPKIIDFLESEKKSTEVNQVYHSGWKKDQTGWWYRNDDGSYTVNNWQFISGEWYYFDEKGYMATGWINWNGKQYYCDSTEGCMLINTRTPDGSEVGADGAKLY